MWICESSLPGTHEEGRRVFEVSVSTADFSAIAAGQKRHHTLVRFVGVPDVGDPIRIAEKVEGVLSGRALFARVTFVEPLDIQTTVLSIEVRMSTDRMLAIRD